MVNIHNIVLYVLFGLLLLGFGFVLYKLFSTNSKLNHVLDFLNGEVFSDQFQQVLRAYFSNGDNITPIVDQILPFTLALTAYEPISPPESPVAASPTPNTQTAAGNESSATTTTRAQKEKDPREKTKTAEPTTVAKSAIFS